MDRSPELSQKRVEHGLLYLVILVAIVLLLLGVYRGGVKLVQLEAQDITLRELPFALTLSLMRMSASYVASLALALLAGLIAARSKLGEKIIIPILDIMQSIPIVGFFPAAITFFIGITHGHRLGVELAAVFLIFTCQAWNMAFAVYEAIRSIPQDSVDVVTSFGIRGSKRFWKLYAPSTVPRLVYNSILSWSNGWFFLVAAEIIAVGPIKYNLPGIGNFLARAAEQDQIHLIFWGLFALTLLILTMDLMIWRPISAWAERFNLEDSSMRDGETATISVVSEKLVSLLEPVIQLTVTAIKSVFYPLIWVMREIILPLTWDLPALIYKKIEPSLPHRSALAKDLKQKSEDNPWLLPTAGWLLLVTALLALLFPVLRLLTPPWPEITREIPLAILASSARVVTGLLLSCLWTIPLVLWAWDKPRWRRTLTTIAQIGASLPAIALFPLIILLLVRRFGGGMESASILLVLTGMQWYVLFNCLGGVSTIPHDIAQAVKSMGLSRFQLWRRLVFPAMRPALVTGAITAWGGGWNTLVVAEYVVYKDQTMTVRGIGALLNHSVYQLGDTPSILFCVTAMVGWIVLWNFLFWQRVYHGAIERYKFEG